MRSIFCFDYVTSGKFATAWKDLTALSTLNTQPMWKVIADNILLPIKHRHRLWESKISNWLDRDFLQRNNIFRPSVDMKFALSIEVWLRKCLPQFSNAYSRLKGA